MLFNGNLLYFILIYRFILYNIIICILPDICVARFVYRTFDMRVGLHTCRHCGEVFQCYSDLRQHLDSHLLPPIGYICTPCKKSFTRLAYLLNTRPVGATMKGNVTYMSTPCHSYGVSVIWASLKTSVPETKISVI